MEEMTSGQQKPLRPTFNKVKDLLDTYGKGKGGRSIPIADSETEKINKENLNENKHHDEELLQEDMNSKRIEELENELNNLKEINNSLLEQSNAFQKERDELKDLLMRKAAEFENFRRRSMDEKQEIIEYANEKLLYRMLEMLDDITSAAEAGKKTTDIESMNKGLEMIMSKAKRLFEDAGVSVMENVVGKQFDVNYHEALMMMNSDMPEGTVVQVIQPGYMLNNKVLRYAKVITSNGNNN